MSTEERTLFCFSLNGASATKCGLWRYFVAPFVNKTSYTKRFTAVFESSNCSIKTSHNRGQIYSNKVVSYRYFRGISSFNVKYDPNK